MRKTFTLLIAFALSLCLFNFPIIAAPANSGEATDRKTNNHSMPVISGAGGIGFSGFGRASSRL